MAPLEIQRFHSEPIRVRGRELRVRELKVRELRVREVRVREPRVGAGFRAKLDMQRFHSEPNHPGFTPTHGPTPAPKHHMLQASGHDHRRVALRYGGDDAT